MLSLIQNNKSWIKLKKCSNFNVPSRNLHPPCGPPRFPMPLVQKILIGGGGILLMMALPLWGLLSLPTWAIKHQNLGKARPQPPPAEEGG